MDINSYVDSTKIHTLIFPGSMYITNVPLQR